MSATSQFSPFTHMVISSSDVAEKIRYIYLLIFFIYGVRIDLIFSVIIIRGHNNNDGWLIL